MIPILPTNECISENIWTHNGSLALQFIIGKSHLFWRVGLKV